MNGRNLRGEAERQPRKPQCWWAVLGCFLAALLSRSVSAQVEFDDYERQIRPILIKSCIQCHGPKKQESDLRLDGPEYWETGGISGPALVPGKPGESLLLKAIKKTDPDLAMPPGDLQLKPEEITTIENWIRQGARAPRADARENDLRLDLAEAGQFWSFKPVIRVVPPSSPAIDRWSWNAIDRFVFQKLSEVGLPPVQEAPKHVLLRRASFDLTGLPPTPPEIQAFVQDETEDAFGTVLERLLESKAYGERWGQHWLDVARYADTAGDGSDYPVREAYKYRDWVINALNNDKPYDEFLREQIAGDILAKTAPPEEYAGLITATGFMAIGKRYGYKPSPDYQHLDFADVIDSMGRSLMGLTLGCARCHDHKYDPISAEDYYALYGIMESTVWSFPGGEEQKRPSHFPATVPEAEVRRLEALRQVEMGDLSEKIKQRTRKRAELNPENTVGGKDLGFEGQTAGESLKSPWVCAGNIKVLEDAQSPFLNVHPQGTRGVRVGAGLRTDGIRYVFQPGLSTERDEAIRFNIDFRTAADAEEGSWRIYLGQGVVESYAVEFSVSAEHIMLRNGGKWEKLSDATPGRWYSLQIEINCGERTYAGVVASATESVQFKDKKTMPNWNGIADCFISDGFGHREGPVLQRDLDNIALTAGSLNTVGMPVEVRKLTAVKKAEIERLDREIDQLVELQGTLSKRPVFEVAYGVSEGQPVNSYLQRRGEPENLGDRIPRRFLEVFGGERVPEMNGGSGRLQLARWVSDSGNPLTARVMVNRIWQWHFGEGLVRTPSDFGSRGDAPSHPELLDWLAAELIENNWSLKHMHRIIMASRTYQLSSRDSKAGLSIDPSNVLLWRYSRRPLDAEAMRDAMLAVSGNLDRTASGQHPFPDVETWNFTIHHPFHAVYGSDHRSVYLMKQRNRRHPYLELFDSADPNVSIGKRQQTITPTQALYLMNSEFVHAQAQRLAHRIAVAVPGRTERIKYAFNLAHGVPVAAEEIRAANAFLDEYITAAQEGRNVDGSKEAWEAFSRVLLTSNRFLFVD